MNKLKPHEGAGSLNEALEGPQSDRTVKQNHLYAGLVKNIVREWNQINTQPKPVDGTGEEAQEKAKRRRVGLVDCFRVLAIAKGQDGISNNLLFTDGLHWTERAYAVSRHVVQNDNYNANPLLCVPVLDPPLDEQYVTKELERVLASIAPELDPGALPFAFDAWQEYLQGQ